MFQVRGVVNQKLEEARNGKLIGASLEAKVYLHASSPKLQEELISMCGSNDVDHLKRIFLTSQVSHNFSHNFEGDIDPSLKIHFIRLSSAFFPLGYICMNLQKKVWSSFLFCLPNLLTNQKAILISSLLLSGLNWFIHSSVIVFRKNLREAVLIRLLTLIEHLYLSEM